MNNSSLNISLTGGFAGLLGNLAGNLPKRNVGRVPVTDTFIVRTECSRNGKEPIVLGKTRMAMMDGVVFACFDVFPSSGGKGECVIRTIVDAENQVNEVDERASSNTLDFKARIQE